jgi:hypothetical protein
MLNLGALGFATPWVLVALIGLPVLWWLLRVTPPAPRRLRFPAIRLLFGLNEDEQTPSHTPWWLILLRMVIVTLVILGLAHPLWNAGDRFTASGPVVLVMDDGWAAARGWNERMRAAEALIARAERANRGVVVMPTAAPSDGAPLTASSLLTPAAARTYVQALQPKPWPVSRAQAKKSFLAARFDDPANITWLADGIKDSANDSSTQDFIRALQRRGPVTAMVDPIDAGAIALVPPQAGEPRLTLKLLRAEKANAARHWVRGLDARGRIVMREGIDFADGATSTEAVINLPTELRNRLARLEVEDVKSAGAVALIDERYRRRPVGIITTAADRAQVQPLLAEVFYLERALGPYAEVRKGTVPELLSRPLAVLVIPDGAGLGDTVRSAIAAWMDKGGTVLRFAGPRLGQNPDALTPVRLRRGDRTLGGAMSWAKPARLAPFEDTSPFSSLTIPKDVTVKRQVLAQPALDLPARTWARLADGSPLVTAASRGRGRILLIHTTANTEWSNLALSGLYVEMLRRVIGLSQGVSGARAGALPPVATLDGFGRLGDPPPSAQPLVEDSAPARATTVGKARTQAQAQAQQTGPQVTALNPPGLYGDESARVALNLAANWKSLTPIGQLPAGVEQLSLAQPGEVDFKPYALAAALILLTLDMWIGLVLRGLAPTFWPTRDGDDLAMGPTTTGATTGATTSISALIAAAITAALALNSLPAQAQQTLSETEQRRAIEATFETRLAYVLTGDARLDTVSRQGLEGLSLTLRTRTSVEPKAPLAVNIERDDITFFPFLYWPITPAQPSLSPRATERLAKYLATGGMILFDTRDQALTTISEPGSEGGSGPGAVKLRELLRGLSIPSLTPVPKGHNLTKSFYLLNEFPGRWTGGTVWVERRSSSANDGVSSVVIGANDFAGAWAIDANGQSAFPVVPGGSRQREIAHRFGVNVVMYALTGNYKSDQVHVPAILERLGQ